MTDKERMQLVEAFHKELSNNKMSYIACIEKSDKKSFVCACNGSWRDVIKMFLMIANIYSEELDVSKRKLCKDLVAVALGGMEKMIYQNTKQYERDKQRWLNMFNSSINGEITLDALDVTELSILLNQSKWNGLQSACQDDD